MTKEVKEIVIRRLYSLYQAQIKKLAELAKLSSISQSEYLRQLIDVDYARKLDAGVLPRHA